MELLTVNEVARKLRLSKSKVYDLKEKIGFIRLDGAIRFVEDEVEAYVLSCRVNGNGARKRRAATFKLKHL